MSHAKRERWFQEHGTYPLLVLGFRDGAIRCLDCAPGGPLDAALFAGNDEGERASCSECGRRLRRAARFGELTEADLTEADTNKSAEDE